MSNDLKHKLTDFEATPPPQAWDKIVAALDESISPAVSEKLYEFQQAPSAGVWNKLNTALNAGAPARILPFYQRRSLRWSGAAVVLLLAGVALFYLMTQRNTSGDLASENGITPFPGLQRDSSDLTGKEVEVVFTPEAEKPDPLPRTTPSTAKARKTVSRPHRIEAVQPSEPVQRRQLLDFSLPVDRYMVYSDGQNEPVKLSKKLYELFACNAEDYTCRQKIRSLQRKLATHAVSSDFTGVLDMLQHLKENQ